MKTEPTDPEWLFKDPRTRKWMRRCVACQRWGYAADAPAEFFGRAHLEKHFGKLELDDRGLCDLCGHVLTAGNQEC